MRRLAAYIVFLFMPFGAWAQQMVTLRDGTQLTGRIISAGDHTLTFHDNMGGPPRTLDFDQIQSIDFSHRPDFGRDRENGFRDERGGAGRVDQGYMVIPSGAEIAVRTNDGIDSRDASEARTYSAEVTRDVVDANGNVVIPRGSPANLVVRTFGDNRLALDLESVSVNGQRFRVNASDLDRGRSGLGANKRTGEFVGGGAALGTLLGAVTGGGKGAAIGALAGAGAGAGAEVLTQGDHVRVPAETVLTFRMDHPVNLMREQP